MNICHISPSYYPATLFGGPIFSVHYMNSALAKLDDVIIEVLTLDSSSPFSRERIPAKNMLEPTASYNVKYYKSSFIRDFSLDIARAMNSGIRQCDIVHITSMYSLTSLAALLYSRIHKKPVILSPRGALQAWSGSRRTLLKKIWNGLCKLLINNSKFSFHVTSMEEENDVKKVFTNAKLVTIPNGVLIPDIEQRARKKRNSVTRLMFIGRLHPKKGLENLIHAIKLLPHRYTLDIYGQGTTGYETVIKALVNDLDLDGRIKFNGHVDGDDKAEAFLNADICIFPSHTENFGVVVAEALSYGVPVIVSRGMPWADIEKHHCGLWVDNSPESMTAAVLEIAQSDLEVMGRNGREWMKREFSWDHIAHDMREVYRSMLT